MKKTNEEWKDIVSRAYRKGWTLIKYKTEALKPTSQIKMAWHTEDRKHGRHIGPMFGNDDGEYCMYCKICGRSFKIKKT